LCVHGMSRIQTLEQTLEYTLSVDIAVSIHVFCVLMNRGQLCWRSWGVQKTRSAYKRVAGLRQHTCS